MNHAAARERQREISARATALANVRTSQRNRVEKMAHVLFGSDNEFDRDREQYGAFEKMPANLQDWWRDRAAGRILDLDRWKGL